jgi:hypothetical protein
MLLAGTVANAAPVILNEYNAVSASNYLGGATSTAADPYFGRVLGNGGDWLELVVIQDHLDLRGGSLSIDEGQVPGRTTTVLTFTQAALWADLRAGTIITVAEDVADDPSYDPFGALGGDWWINVQASNTASGLYITASNFSVSNDDTQVTIFDGVGTLLFGPAGEGITANAGVSSTEMYKLEANPSAAITPASTDYHDGTSSTFGAPNRWSANTLEQDFSALRPVPEPGAATLFGVALAGLAALSACRARRAA